MGVLDKTGGKFWSETNFDILDSVVATLQDEITTLEQQVATLQQEVTHLEQNALIVVD